MFDLRNVGLDDGLFQRSAVVESKVAKFRNAFRYRHFAQLQAVAEGEKADAFQRGGKLNGLYGVAKEERSRCHFNRSLGHFIVGRPHIGKREQLFSALVEENAVDVFQHWVFGVDRDALQSGAREKDLVA